MHSVIFYWHQTIIISFWFCIYRVRIKLLFRTSVIYIGLYHI